VFEAKNPVAIVNRYGNAGIIRYVVIRTERQVSGFDYSRQVSNWSREWLGYERRSRSPMGGKFSSIWTYSSPESCSCSRLARRLLVRWTSERTRVGEREGERDGDLAGDLAGDLVGECAGDRAGMSGDGDLLRSLRQSAKFLG
jgi:hypothetical protein